MLRFPLVAAAAKPEPASELGLTTHRDGFRRALERLTDAYSLLAVLEVAADGSDVTVGGKQVQHFHFSCKVKCQK